MVWKLYSYLKDMNLDSIPANRIHSIFLSSIYFTCILVFFSSLRPGTHSSNLLSVTRPEIYMYFSHLPWVILHTFVLRVSLSHTLLRPCYVCFYITCELIFALHVYLFHLSTFISVTLVSLTWLYLHSYCDCFCPSFAPVIFSVCLLSDILAIFWANPVIPQVKIFILEQKIRPRALQSKRSATSLLQP